MLPVPSIPSQPSTPKRVPQLTPQQCIRSPFSTGYTKMHSPFSKSYPVDHFNDDLIHVFKARLSPCYSESMGTVRSPMVATSQKVYDITASDHAQYSSYYVSHRTGQLSSPSLSYSFKESISFGGQGHVYSPPTLTPMPSNYSSSSMANVKGVVGYNPIETCSTMASAKHSVYEERGNVNESTLGTSQLNSSDKNVPLHQLEFLYNDPHGFSGPCCNDYEDNYHPYSEFIHDDINYNAIYNGHSKPIQSHSCHDEIGQLSYSYREPNTDNISPPPINGSSSLSSFTTYLSTSNELGHSGHSNISSHTQRLYSTPPSYVDSAKIDERIKAVPTLPGSSRCDKTKTKPVSSFTCPEIKRNSSVTSLYASTGEPSDLYRPPVPLETTEDEKVTDGYAESDSSTTDCYVMRRKPCTNWAPEEDNALIKVVTALGTRNWKNVAKLVHRECPHLPERSADQCSQHWLRVLDPSIVKGKWTPEDDRALIEAVKICPPRQWKMIANYVKGRTDIQVRYRMKRLAKSLIKRNILPREKLP